MRAPVALQIFSLALVVAGAGVAQQNPTWTQMCSPPGPQGTYFPAMTYDSVRQQIVLFGGSNLSANTQLDETWIWDGIGWTEKTPPNKPPARNAHSMVFDASHGEVVLFGGSVSGVIANDTWVWDGTTWTQRFPTTIPPARLSAGMVFDTALQRVLLIGGSDGSPSGFADTWAWDGADWTQLASAPSGRSNLGVAYDSVRHQTVVFGGQNAGALVTDTGLFDGTTWSTISGGPTPLRQDDRMPFDIALGQIVLFGGSGPGGSPLYGDTWIWNGSGWAQASPADAPPARTAHSMAYDAAHSQIVVFGGEVAPSFTFPGDTWVYGAATSGCVVPPPCSPPKSIYTTVNAGGLISTSVSNPELANGFLTANITIQNPLRFWLGLVDESKTVGAILSPNTSAGEEGVAAAQGLISACGAPPFFVDCPVDFQGGAAWVAQFCSPGVITLEYGETLISAGITLVDALVPGGPADTTLTLATNLQAVPDWVKIEQCFTTVGANTPGCLAISVLNLITNPKQLEAVLAIFNQARIELSTGDLIGKLTLFLGSGETLEDLIRFGIQTASAGHYGTVTIQIVGK